VAELRKCTFSIELAYDGADFSGWQSQPGKRTVQGFFKKWLEQILNQPLNIIGAGRTDAGVHARATVISFEAFTALSSYELLRAIRRVTPYDIHVIRVDERPAGFDARFSATAREYEYVIVRWMDPFRRHYAWCTDYKLDLDKMQYALEPLKGKLDCTGFCVAQSLPPTAWCEFKHIALIERGDTLHFEVCCNRFLHGMVRSLIGTLHDIGRGRYSADQMSRILDQKDRTLVGQTAPPQGLFLRSVYYKDFVTGSPSARNND
jgi:tRNA pseudouridine38-40 synthase